MSRLGDPSTKDIVLRLSRSSFSQHEREVESGSERHKRIPSKATSEGSFFWPIVNVWDRRLVSLVPVALLGFTVSETPRARGSFREGLCEIWLLVSNNGLNRVLLCRFVGGMFAGVSASAVNPIAFYYAGVQPLNDTVVSFVALGGVLWALNWVDKKGWDVNYRTVIVVATITTLAMDVGTTMFTIWDLLASLLWLFALPKHASEAQELKLRSGTSTIHGAGLLMLLGASLPFVVAVHVLSVYEPTACLGFSGGTGC
ncbi:hypothetical protein PC123_g17551 [Phytophthora cactorum]|nr:hypothetical protein PC123_g17551 [Phytophthora cactorum]